MVVIINVCLCLFNLFPILLKNYSVRMVDLPPDVLNKMNVLVSEFFLCNEEYMNNISEVVEMVPHYLLKWVYRPCQIQNLDVVSSELNDEY